MDLDTGVLDYNIGDQNKWQIWDQGVYFGFDPLQTGRNHGTHIRMKEISLLTCLSRVLALTVLQSSVLSLQHPTAQPSAGWNSLDSVWNLQFCTEGQGTCHRWRVNSVIHMNIAWDAYSPGLWDTSQPWHCQGRPVKKKSMGHTHLSYYKPKKHYSEHFS